MSDPLLIGFVVVAAAIGVRQLARLDRLAHEFRHVAREMEVGATDLFRAIIAGFDLHRQQRVLRTEAMEASCLLILSFCGLLGVVVISW